MLNQLELHLGKNATEISISNPIGAIDITWKYATEGLGGHLFFLLEDLKGIITDKFGDNLQYPHFGTRLLHLNFSNYHIVLKYGKPDFDKFEEHKAIVLKAFKNRNLSR